MSRTQPTEDATFPVYRVQAKCPKCGKQGETKALKHYSEGTVITTPCSRCVGNWEARLQQLGKPRPLREVRGERKCVDPSGQEGAVVPTPGIRRCRLRRREGGLTLSSGPWR